MDTPPRHLMGPAFTAAIWTSKPAQFEQLERTHDVKYVDAFVDRNAQNHRVPPPLDVGATL